MELDEFVQKSIEQVITGVGKACKFAEDNMASIGGNSYERIEFDVAVTTSEASETKKSGGISVAGISLGANGKADSTSSTVSRIKFTLVVSLPSTRAS